jgi:hypothetical protein
MGTFQKAMLFRNWGALDRTERSPSVREVAECTAALYITLRRHLFSAQPAKQYSVAEGANTSSDVTIHISFRNFTFGSSV